ncbi:unnamed protein product, partial [Schistosoma curassoni]|uniref:Coagulation factor V n=1 Tax=Schistosoma curassoni TaxID=6186 RepID=A0A183KVU6_9TREM
SLNTRESFQQGIVKQNEGLRRRPTSPIAIDRKDLEDVKTFKHLDSIIDESADRQSKSSIFTTEEHLELNTTVNQQQSQNFQYKYQDSSTVCGRNPENYESHHPADTCVC